jgi:hypothetical protein
VFYYPRKMKMPVASEISSCSRSKSSVLSRVLSHFPDAASNSYRRGPLHTAEGVQCFESAIVRL